MEQNSSPFESSHFCQALEAEKNYSMLNFWNGLFAADLLKNDFVVDFGISQHEMKLWDSYPPIHTSLPDH